MKRSRSVADPRWPAGDEVRVPDEEEAAGDPLAPAAMKKAPEWP
jgi:hypothetical protein